MTTSSVNVKIRRIYAELSAKEQLIADYILKKPEEFIHHTISDISASLGLAESTVFRFCKKLGFNGFQDLKIVIAMETIGPITQINENVHPNDSEIDITKKVFSANVKSLEDTFAIVNEEQMKKAVFYLRQSKKIAFFGVGGSAVVALDAYHKFLRSSKECIFNLDKHFQMMEAAKLTPDNCVIIISHSGMNKDTLDICGAAKTKGAKIIAITSYPSSLLPKEADISLFSVSEENDYRSEALASRIAQLSLIDALYVNTVIYHREEFDESLSNMRGAISNTKHTQQ